MDLAHAIAAGGLAARLTDRRFTGGDAEVREAEQRVIARRAAAVAASGQASGAASGKASGNREYPERGRHAAPRPVRA
jgi:hypothetical protein